MNEANLKLYWSRFTSSQHRTTNEALKLADNNNDALLSNNETNASSLFAHMYHSLIHSNAFMKIVFKKERLLMLDYNSLLRERDNTLRFIQDTHQVNLNEKLKPENGYSDSYISKLAMANIELIEMERHKWATRLDTLKSLQQRKFRKFVNKLFEYKTTSSNAALTDQIEEFLLSDSTEDEQDFEAFQFKSSTSGSSSAKASAKSAKSAADPSFNKIEESYTIQLGAQLKTTHNLRLIRCDTLDYCKDRFKSLNSAHQSEDLFEQIEPQSIMTAMSLYSESLCAVVLLVDSDLDKVKFNHANKDNGQLEASVSARLIEICDRNGCDFHFSSIDQQIEVASKCVHSVNEMKRSETDSASARLDSLSLSDAEACRLNVGDFYVTKHSNLSQAHVLFHLVARDGENSGNRQVEVKGQSLRHSDLSSRHPVILGLRNILKSCISHNIHTLTFPLLLTHEMTEVNFFF